MSTSGSGGPARGTLYVVASTLGNADDLSPRAAQTLATVDLILAEDTRSARRLLDEHHLDRPLRSCFDANEAARASEAAALLSEGKSLAVLSEAGTPTVSDPGYKIVRAALEVGARVVPIPGPSAVLAALSASGLPTDRFYFVGFPPRKPGARRALFAELQGLRATLVFYESPHRVAATLADLAAALGPTRGACLAREITKHHEEFVRASLGELAARYAQDRPLGEVTLVVGGVPADEDAEPMDDEEIVERAGALLGAGHSSRESADLLASETGRPRREIYALVLRAKEARDGDGDGDGEGERDGGGEGEGEREGS